MFILTATRAILAALTVLMTVAFGASAYAAEVTFVIKNEHPNALELELYSQGRNHVWPGGGEVYVLDDGETKEVPLTCNTGESICYGAWISGDRDTYWGVGPGNAERCSDCCYKCQGGSTEEIVLSQ